MSPHKEAPPLPDAGHQPTGSKPCNACMVGKTLGQEKCPGRRFGGWLLGLLKKAWKTLKQLFIGKGG